MKKSFYIILIITALLTTAKNLQAASQEKSSEKPSKQYYVKAAFLYNFTKFIDWPPPEKSDEKNNNQNENKETQIVKEPNDCNDIKTIGIIGRNPFGNIFEKMIEKQGEDKKIAVKKFHSFIVIDKPDKKEKILLEKQKLQLEKCHLLFICHSEIEKVEIIAQTLKEKPVLLVGETKNFIKQKGMIRFLEENRKIRFIINLDATEKAGLQIRSKLLKLAKKVIQK